MKKILFACLAALSLPACEIAGDFNEDFILPPTNDVIIQVVNATYIESVLSDLEGLQEILYYIQTGDSQAVHVYGSTYEVDHLGGNYKEERASKSDPPYWRCDPYGTQGPSLKFVSENGRWIVSTIDEKYAYEMLISVKEERSVNGATFEVSGIRPDESGPYNVKFHSLTPMQCRWLTSNVNDEMRVLSLEGSMHYDFCKDDTVIESEDRSYTF